MDVSRCPGCKKRLIAMTDRTGRTKLACLKCDRIDPMKTDAVKWASSSLATSALSRPSTDEGPAARSLSTAEGSSKSFSGL
jgi:hypothetical protein